MCLNLYIVFKFLRVEIDWKYATYVTHKAIIKVKLTHAKILRNPTVSVLIQNVAILFIVITSSV